MIDSYSNFRSFTGSFVQQYLCYGNINTRVLVDCEFKRLERVFCCCSVCETMEDDKEGYLMVWTNYTSP